MQITQRAALAEIARLKQADSDPAAGKPIDANWVSATFLVGVMKLLDASDAPELLDFASRTAQRFHYAFHGDGRPVDLLDPDYQAIGDLYQGLYQRSGAPGVLLPLQQRLDYTLPYLTRTPAPKKLVWWWCDVMFMAPPVMTRMAALTGNPAYLQAMDVQWWRIHERLYDAHEHLYQRYEGDIESPSPNGQRPFWSRGQGWVIAGLARMLEDMPQDFPSRPRYVQLFQELATRLVSLQHSDGLWRASLLDDQAFPDAETSGTAFFAYALAFGINHGLLDRHTFLPPVLKAWAGLNRYVLPNGVLGQVRTGGDAGVPINPQTTALYASGAFIMAGVEVAQLGLPVIALPLKRVPPPVAPAHSSITPRAAPADATAEQQLAFQRREAQRRAIAELPFDPVTDDAAYVSPSPLITTR